MNKLEEIPDYDEAQIKKILKRLGAKMEENKINLESRVHRIDPGLTLTEQEFYEIFSDKDLDLLESEQTALLSKYLNTINNSVCVDQLFVDLKKQTQVTAKPGEYKKDPEILKKISRKATKERKGGLLIKECFMSDKNDERVLSEKQIQKAFHYVDLKISDKQLENLLMNQVPDKDGNYNYAKLLTEMFGEKEVKRYKDRMHLSSEKKKSTMSTRKDRKRETNENRFGTRRPSHSSSRSLGNSSVSSRRSSRSGKAKAERRVDDRGRKAREDSLNPRGTDLKKIEDRSTSLNPRGKRDETDSPRDKRDNDRSLRDKNRSPKDDRRNYNRGRDDRSKSLNKREESLNPRSKSRPRDKDEYSSSEELSKDRSPIKTRSSGKDSFRDTLDRGKPSKSSKGFTRPDPKDLKSSMRKDAPAQKNERREATSITRIVGTRIKNSKKDYIKAFKESNNHHKSKLITDEELMRALKDLDIPLKYGDEKNLLIEIDTQNIRKNNRMFSYEKFLEKAGVPIKSSEESQKSIGRNMSSKDLRLVEAEIDIIKKELINNELTLHKMADIRSTDKTIPWDTFKFAIEDHLRKYWIELSGDKDRLALLRQYLCEEDNKTIEIKSLNKLFGIDPQRSDSPDLFEQEDDFKGDERINKPASRTAKKSQMDYSDEEEEDDDYGRHRDSRGRRDDIRKVESRKRYERETLRLDDKGRMNIAVNNLIQHFKVRGIDFDKEFNSKSGLYTDQEFSALLEKLEYSTQDPDEFDSLRAAFRDDKDRKSLSVKRMKHMFNTIDPSYLNKGALKSAHDAKMRLADLPDDVKENITRIDNFFKRNKYDIRHVFKTMDINKDGLISEDEFCKVLLKRFKVPGFDITQLKKIFHQLDINKSKTVTIGELMYFMEGAQRTEEERKKQMSKDVKEQILYDINKLYDEFDTENKGYITDKDLYIIFKASGLYIDINQCKDIIRDNGGRNTGHMSKRDFQDVMMEKMMTELIEDEDSINDLNSMFHQADINKDGYLTIDELEIMFKQYNTNIEKADLIGLMKEIDVDGDGRLDIDEFLALMTLDHESFKDSSSGNTLMKMKKSAKTPAYNFAKYFKVLPKQFIESFTTRLWKRKENLPSSVFEPKINPNTLLYKDLKKDMTPTEKDSPLLSFQIFLSDARGVPYPEQDPKKTDLQVMKREVRVSMYDVATNTFIGNSAIVASIYNKSEPDTWKFNKWKSAVGTNPLIFTSKDADVVVHGDVDLIFEFVIVCKGSNNATKDISCGFASLHLKEFKQFKNYSGAPSIKTLEIQGGSPDKPIPADEFDFKKDLGAWKKMTRGTIKSKITIDLRYFNKMSAEGKFYISMLPSTCIINKKLLHFLAGYR